MTRVLWIFSTKKKLAPRGPTIPAAMESLMYFSRLYQAMTRSVPNTNIILIAANVRIVNSEPRES